MATNPMGSAAASQERTGAGSLANRKFWGEDGERTKSPLEQALARERTLRRQIDELLQHQHDASKRLFARRNGAADRLMTFTPRQRQIMELVVAGHRSKNIAADLGLSQRTVEGHRAAVMKKADVKSIPELARFALAATWMGDGDPSPRSGSITLPARRGHNDNRRTRI